MQRYFLEEIDSGNGRLTITGDDAKHIAKVMRQSAGDRLIAVVSGKPHLAEITDIAADVQIKLIEELEDRSELPKKVTIACGLPKGDKLELITQKATELGMSALLPYSAERSIVKWDGAKSAKKIGRLKKIAKEAAEQSHRSRIPAIHTVHSFKELVNAVKDYDAVIVAYEEEAKQGGGRRFAEILESLYDKDSILLVFGPEGGISEAEASALKETGASFTALGPRILRTETAPLYALSAISYEFE
ncbi:16S rRNA (uracil(1498)-N(3))-methyltransferase [Planococcus maitriensis]|uniref:Ribosomal RNA small subunit methyltransferase E n=1 Tax=Planococcus maitriensis TaxID=221799 RepID=A0A365K792_9BACL|nr:16S rRNA (uracil(1498)-N(3))-methyltransferase [Planococcus maitriensis]RAZ68501.1 16S rRNA (uracil(1498)-N(3))-methyltransferase [Planococcus maitriensis]